WFQHRASARPSPRRRPARTIVGSRQLSDKKRLSWQFAGAKRDTPGVWRAILRRAALAISARKPRFAKRGASQLGKLVDENGAPVRIKMRTLMLLKVRYDPNC